MKNCSRLEMMKVFLRALNSDVVKNSEWIYGSKKRKTERERKSVFYEQRSPRPLVLNSITITASKDI
jgi:hypothetical protein